jgi:hypothetical protein
MTWSVAGLWGLRYIHVSDKFNLNCSDTATGDFENIDNKTANHFLGPQVCLQFIRDWNRFQLNFKSKAGHYADFFTASYSNLNSSSTINSNPAGFVPTSQTNHATDVAGAFEFSLIGRYRVNDHLWICGWNDYFLAGVALGPRQLQPQRWHRPQWSVAGTRSRRAVSQESRNRVDSAAVPALAYLAPQISSR